MTMVSAQRDDTDANANSASLLTVQEAAATLRIGRNMCYELIRQGRIPHVRLGRLIRVPRFGLESWIAQQSGLQANAAVVSFPPQRH